MQQLLTVTEVSRLLRVSPVTLRRMCAAKEINYLRVRGGIRFEPEQVEEYKKACTVKAREGAA